MLLLHLRLLIIEQVQRSTKMGSIALHPIVACEHKVLPSISENRALVVKLLEIYLREYSEKKLNFIFIRIDRTQFNEDGRF